MVVNLEDINNSFINQVEISNDNNLDNYCEAYLNNVTSQKPMAWRERSLYI